MQISHQMKKGVNMKVFRIFETYNFAAYMNLIRDHLLPKKGLEGKGKLLTEQF
jgi:hypothetical protein